MRRTKVDNGNWAAKLNLREYFLGKYHNDRPPLVLDCCQGNGIIWEKLRMRHALAGYWGVDLKPRMGRLLIDSVQILQQPGWPQNVIDIDTYGLPWKHWMAMLPNVSQPTTVFMTIGRIGWTMVDASGLAAMGLSAMRPPPAILMRLHGLALDYLLHKPSDYGLRIVEASQAAGRGQVLYVGVRLEPQNIRPMFDELA
jgi:hypothetical protein